MTKQEEKVIETLTKLKKEFPSAYHLIKAIENFGLYYGVAYSTKTGRWKYVSPQDDYFNYPKYPDYSYEGDYPCFRAIIIQGNWYCGILGKRGNIYLGFSKETGELVDYLGEIKSLKLTKVNDHYIIEEKEKKNDKHN